MELIFDEDFFDQKDYLGRAATFFSKADDRGSSQPLDRNQSVKVSVERHDHTAVRRCLGEDLVVFGPLHPELTNVMARIAQFAKQRRCIRRNSLIEQKFERIHSLGG